MQALHFMLLNTQVENAVGHYVHAKIDLRFSWPFSSAASPLVAKVSRVCWSWRSTCCFASFSESFSDRKSAM